MAEFLQKHRKKGILAALLLFLKRSRVLWGFLAMIVVLFSTFVGPTKIGSGLWLQMVGERMGLGAALGSKAKAGAADELERALDTARVRPTLNRISDTVGSNGESIALITGGKDLIARGERINVAASLAKKGGKTVGGILNPEDAAKADLGVAVDEDELRSGLANAYAGEVAAGGASLAGGTPVGPGTGVSDTGYVSASNSSLDMIQNNFGDQKVPMVGPGSFRGASHGSAGWNKMAGVHSRLGQAAGLQPGGKSSVMYQLAEGRAYSIAAAPSSDGGMGHCNPGPCPAEYASNTGGSVFDGGKGGRQILTASELGEATSPTTPDSSVTTPLITEATKLENDMKKCEEAENAHGPAERMYMAKIQKASDDMVKEGCNSGGCSQSLANKCRGIAQSQGMKDSCDKYNFEANEIGKACNTPEANRPLMKCNTYDQ